MKKIMVFGYGKMGKKHVHFLSQRKDCICNFFDPYYNNDINHNYDYAIIATPILNHYQLYKEIRSQFNGSILIEKPAVIYREHFDIFDDEKIFVGLIERFNPVISRLRELLHDKQINSIEFTRISESCSGEPYFELAIHDLDLMTYLMGIKHITFDYFKCIGKIYEAKLNYGNTTCMFSWGIGSNCRMIKISYNDEQLIVDLVNLTITSKLGIEIFNDSPLRLEHDAFLNNEYLTDVKYSHELMIGLLQC